MKPRIFVCFRKPDERTARDRVHRALVAAFGPDQVFKSGTSITPGTAFVDVLTTQAGRCEVMLVLIGPRWADLADDAGARLLDRPHDWVRLEIETALRAGNRVVPVLLGDATMLPGAADLPPSIAALAGLQFLRVEESRIEAGLEALTAMLATLFPGLGPGGPAGSGPVGPVGAAGPAGSAASAVRPGAVDGERAAARPAPAGLRQTAKATRGGVSLNVGGNLSGTDIRITGAAPEA